MNAVQRVKYSNSNYAGITTQTLNMVFTVDLGLAWSLRIYEWSYFPIT